MYARQEEREKSTSRFGPAFDSKSINVRHSYVSCVVLPLVGIIPSVSGSRPPQFTIERALQLHDIRLSFISRNELSLVFERQKMGSRSSRLLVRPGARRYSQGQPSHNADKRKHFPITIGQKLSERFEILRKLGQGRTSNVWLVRDLNSA